MTHRRVFVSSTCEDVIDLRHELHKHIETIGLVPVLSDVPESSFKPQPGDSTVENCLANLRGCDAVLVILSQRYGWVDPSCGKSVTHLEYEEAIRCGKETHVFVRDRLIADYEKYRNTGDLANLRWINQSDAGKLMDFIKLHLTSIPSGAAWRDVYRSSVDLKQFVSRALGPLAKDARLRQLEDKGQLPLMTIRAQPVFGNHKLRLHILNAGPSCAYNVRVDFSRGQVGVSDIGSISPGVEKIVDLNYWPGSRPTSGKFWIGIRYGTHFGLEFIDHYAVVGSPVDVEQIDKIEYHGKSLESNVSDWGTPQPVVCDNHLVIPDSAIARSTVQVMPPAIVRIA